MAERHEVLRTVSPRSRGAAGAGDRCRLGAAVPDLVDLAALPAAARRGGGRGGARARGGRRGRSTSSAGQCSRSTMLRLAGRGVGGPLHHAPHRERRLVNGRLGARGVGALRGRRGEGIAARLPELPVQYADFAAWQRRWLAGEALERRARLLEARARRGASPPRPAVRPPATGGGGLGERGSAGSPCRAPWRLRSAPSGAGEGATVFMVASWPASRRCFRVSPGRRTSRSARRSPGARAARWRA